MSFSSREVEQQKQEQQQQSWLHTSHIAAMPCDIRVAWCSLVVINETSIDDGVTVHLMVYIEVVEGEKFWCGAEF